MSGGAAGARELKRRTALANATHASVSTELGASGARTAGGGGRMLHAEAARRTTTTLVRSGATSAATGGHGDDDVSMWSR